MLQNRNFNGHDHAANFSVSLAFDDFLERFFCASCASEELSVFLLSLLDSSMEFAVGY